jgi:hypothetical protein
MPMVGGKKFAYTEEGKKKAKKAAIENMIAKKSKNGPRKPKFSGVKSQMGSTY